MFLNAKINKYIQLSKYKVLKKKRMDRKHVTISRRLAFD